MVMNEAMNWKVAGGDQTYFRIVPSFWSLFLKKQGEGY
jgi:hypothetical protein